MRDQLIASGIPPSRVWLSGYGADPAVFHAKGRTAPARFRIVFAGQASLRKDMRTLFAALKMSAASDWPSCEMHFYGGVAPEVNSDIAAYNGPIPLTWHGAVSQHELAAAFREASVLVLPSLEEGFGLVIPQALNCGLPCIVSDRVGGKDLVRHRENGSIFPTGDAAALAAELAWWQANWHPVDETHAWPRPAADLIRQSTENLQTLA